MKYVAHYPKGRGSAIDLQVLGKFAPDEARVVDLDPSDAAKVHNMTPLELAHEGSPAAVDYLEKHEKEKARIKKNAVARRKAANALAAERKPAASGRSARRAATMLPKRSKKAKE